MGSLLAFPLAMPLGGVQVSDIRAVSLGHDQWLVSWTANAEPSDASYMIAIDGKHYTTVINATSAIIRGEFGSSPIVEVVQLPGAISDPGYFVPGYFTTPQQNKIKLTWNPPASVADVSKYRVYWDNAEGTVQYTSAYLIGTVFESGASSYEFWTDELSSDTYKFVIRTVDAAGNESTNTTATSVVLAGLPDIVTGVSISFSGGTATITWTDPANIGAGNVRIYDNSGTAANFYPDYSSATATIAAGTETWTSGALADGTWVFGLRVYDGTNEEPNTSVLASVRVDSGAQVTGFPIKPTLYARNSDSGQVILQARVQNNVGAKAQKVKFFTNDGAGGAVDYGSAIGGGFVALFIQPVQSTVEITAGPYGETARKFGLIAYTTDNIASVQADEVTITPDATDPPQPLSVAGTTGRN